MKAPWVAVTIVAVSCLAAPARAQGVTSGDGCQPVVPTRVVLTATDGARNTGTLLCLGAATVALLDEGGVTRRPLPDVRRIVTPGDGVIDGLLKGSAIGVLLWGALCHECDGSYRAQGILAYALLGVTLDALHSHRRTIYAGPGRAAVRLRVRF
jgi:hypothetical protein